MILHALDRLVLARRITGYTVESDAGYLTAPLPTLTYRMYVEGGESRANLGEFCAAMAPRADHMTLSAVEGVVAEGASLRRTSQICLSVPFATSAELGDAVSEVERHFVAAPDAVPGSWRYPDVRVVGDADGAMEGVFAHRWERGARSVVVLTLEPEAPLPGADTHRVGVLRSWVGFLQSTFEVGTAAV